MKINESVDNNHIQKVVTIMKPPYLEDLRMFNIPTEKWEEVFSLLFNRDMNSIELDRNINRDATILYVDIPTNPPKLPLYVEWDNGPWLLRDYDDNGNMIYYEESDGYWEKYEFDNDSNPTYYENSEGYSDDYSENSLNESVESNDRRKNYLDKVLEFILSDTQIDPNPVWPSNWINIYVPFTNLVYSRIMHFDREDFFDYCRDTYGLTKDESYSVWEDYVDKVNQILRKDWGITDPVYH